MAQNSLIKQKNRRAVNVVGGRGNINNHYDWTVGHAATILDSLDDGLFRTQTQIRKATGLERNILHGTLARLLRLGGVERYNKPGVDLRLGAGVRPAGWLYRITDKGRKRKPPAG